MKCKDCRLSAHKVKCTTCGGSGFGPVGGRPFSEQICRACSGEGRMFRMVAIACDSCAGLGVMLVPTSKPDARLTE